MSLPFLFTAVAAFLAAVLSGLGLGSAGIFVLYLTFLAGFPQVEAQGVNLCFFLLSGGTSLLLHVRRRAIPWRLVVFLTVCAVPGTVLGAYLAQVLDASLVRRLFGGMLVLAGMPTLWAHPKAKATARTP